MKKIKKYKRRVKEKLDDFSEELYFFGSSFKNYFSKIKKTLKEKIKNFFEKTSAWFKKIIKFILTVFGYGFLINYALWAIWGIKFNLFTLPAYGIVYYFISEEFISFIRLIFHRR